MSWHVLYLQPRCEKKMGEYARVHGWKFYLPLRQETKIYQRRKVTVEKPVFPGYFFVSFEPDERTALLKTNRIVRILKPERQRTLLYQLAQIRRALTADPTLRPSSALRRGHRVRITTGPFTGIEGVVWGTKGTAKVRLNIDLIGQAVTVDVDVALLEILD